MPPATVLGSLVVVSATTTIARKVQEQSLWRPIILPVRGMGVAVLVMTCCVQAILFGLTARQMRIQQKVIESNERVQIGLWLKDHVQPKDRIYLESLGYIGYFSGGHMIDFPGLVSPEVVRYRRNLKADQYSMIGFVQPEWIVLRNKEAEAMQSSCMGEYFASNYEPAESFDVGPRLEEYGFIPGKAYLLYDACFHIYRKKNQTALASQAGSNRQ
jgi:hypothetical protein